mmetsp:Transcript_27017/g.81008  ORF Transcript_27017/g.81008 Transcript_27017/m.81008 type:complete len:343 (-) Transcript_27017:16-1044(-)
MSLDCWRHVRAGHHPDGGRRLAGPRCGRRRVRGRVSLGGGRNVRGAPAAGARRPQIPHAPLGPGRRQPGHLRAGPGGGRGRAGLARGRAQHALLRRVRGHVAEILLGAARLDGRRARGGHPRPRRLRPPDSGRYRLEQLGLHRDQRPGRAGRGRGPGRGLLPRGAAGHAAVVRQPGEALPRGRVRPRDRRLARREVPRGPAPVPGRGGPAQARARVGRRHVRRRRRERGDGHVHPRDRRGHHGALLRLPHRGRLLRERVRGPAARVRAEAALRAQRGRRPHRALPRQAGHGLRGPRGQREFVDGGDGPRRPPRLVRRGGPDGRAGVGPGGGPRFSRRRYVIV